ncbi:MAG: AAA family ATPase [Candidatus Aenigmarchaeota archaeon]|nr:AAA family ATPase [Candidatus Aenigmarchaeota archaeon]
MEHAMKFRHEYKLSTHYPILIGRTQQIKDIRKTIRQICTKDFPVLISGEQGTGKDLIAQAIHYHSSRRRGSLVKINCGLLAEDFSVEGIFESQERLFTETKKDERGLFEIANGATLVFDEIDRLSLPLQIEFQR